MGKLRPSLRNTAPSLEVERSCWSAGEATVAGVDEVGRGAWAGPLTVGIAVIPRDRRIYKLRDSKLLSEEEREELFPRLVAWCDHWSVGHASPQECDELGMSQAQRLATRRAIGSLGRQPDRFLIDGRWDFVRTGRTTTIVHGDASSVAIAAASVLAKVTRDRIMRRLSVELPWYRFERNKGYPSPAHRAGLQAWGPSTAHRTSWASMDDLMWTGVRRSGRLFSVP